MVNVKFKVIWDDKAKASLKEIIKYIKKDSLLNADIVKKEIVDTTRKLNNFPEKFSKEYYLKDTNLNYRFKAIYSYKIIYRISEKEIRIVDIFHTSRNPEEINK